jgi:adenylate cyclase
MDAWEAFHRGLWFADRIDPESNATARGWFEQAIALDPTFAQAHASLLHTYLNEIYLFYSRDPMEALATAESHGRRAVALDPADAAAHTGLAWAASAGGDMVTALARADAALGINPNHVDAHRVRGSVLLWLGRLEEARETINLCLHLSPQDSRNWVGLHHLAVIGYVTQDYVMAVAAARRSLDERPTATLSYRWLAASLGQLGRRDEAREVMRRAASVLAPLSFDEYAIQRGPWLPDAYHRHMLEGLQLAEWRPPE